MSLKDDICRHDAPMMQPRRVTALVPHADPLGVSQPNKVDMMFECSIGKLLTRAAFMHLDDQGHDALRYHALPKGLK